MLSLHPREESEEGSGTHRPITAAGTLPTEPKLSSGFPWVFQSKKLNRNEDVTDWCVPEKSDNKSIINYSTLYSSEPGIVPGSFLYASILGVYYIIGCPFWVQQTGPPNYLVLQIIFATFADWREIYHAINICEKGLSQKNIVLATFAAWREIYNAINICEKELSQRRKERKDNDTTDYVSKQTGQTWWKL